MISILSTSNELTTEDVMDWLEAMGSEVVRINDNDAIDHITRENLIVSDNDIRFEIHGNQNKESQILINSNVIWLRKFGFFHQSKTNKRSRHFSHNDIKGHLISEYKSSLEVTFRVLKDKAWLSHPDSVKPNKIDLLIEAKKVGLSIPRTSGSRKSSSEGGRLVGA